MRLHHLTLTAIGPFGGTEQVDFDRLGAGGLFLLEGPTGAGKTTVLDAVTFALFGAVSGPASSPGRLHSQFAAPGITPRVVLEVTLRGARYRIRRTPEHQRPKRRGEGFTTEKATALLQRVEGGEVLPLATTIDDVNVQIRDLVGLDADQFRQVVLLPQGEFATFLRSTGDDRETVLSRLFDVVGYRQVTQWLEQRATTARRERDEAEQAIGRAAAAAAAAAGLDANAPLVAARGDALSAALGEQAHRLESEESAAAAAAAEVTAVRAGAADALAEATRAAERFGRWRAALAEAAALEATAAEHEARRAQLARARVAAPLVPQLAAVDDAASSLYEAVGQLAALDPDGAAAPPGTPAPDVRAAATRARTDAARLDEAVALEDSAPRRAEAISTAAQRVVALEAEAAAAHDEAEALPARIAALHADEQACAAAQGALPGQQDALASAAAVLAAARRLETLGPTLAEASAAAAAAAAAARETGAAAQRARAGRIAGIAAALAERLRPGEPCTVCGSTEHPAPARPTADHVSAEEADLAEAAAADAADASEAAAAARSALERDVAAAAAVAGTLDRAAAEASHHAAAEAVAASRVSAGKAPEVSATLAAAELALAGAGSRRSHFAGELATRAERLAHLRLEAERDELVLAGARGEHSTVAGRRAALLAAADRLDAVADAVDAAAKAEADLGTASRRLDDLLAGAGLADAATARANALDPAALVALADRVEADEQHRTAVRGRLEADEFAGLDGAGERAARSAVAEAEAVARAAADAEEAALAAHALAAERVRAFAGACGHVATTRTGADDVIASTTPVLRLDALARGTAGDPRMSLVVFVLRYWFDHVVEAANLRLTTMSAGRYQLERTDETETRAKRAGLGLQVVDTHTGASRPTASLSGGETFFASLSLALGLADVVRAQAGGGDLDTLFIDEGFGTLDADTLEQVMDVVDALREGGRVVGIVSHVDDLKARIPERLEVRRHDDGSSWLAVRA